MRIIHTSDWHLGQRFMGESREAEHKLFLQWLLEIISREEIDALLVSGDIFDTATPPSYARKLYNDFLVEASKSGCPNIIIIGGNHDSVAVLNEQKKLLKYINIHIVSSIDEFDDEIILIRNRKGVAVGVVAAVPYIRESDIRVSGSSSDTQDRSKALQQAIAEHYQELYQECEIVKESYIRRHSDGYHGDDVEFDDVMIECMITSHDTLKEMSIIAMGHMSAIKLPKEDISEAMRDIYIGTLEAFDNSLFPPFDYIALGHFHKKMQMKNICYSGTPVALSFDEAKTPRYILDVNVTPHRLAINPIEVPVWRKLHTISGTIDEIKKIHKTLKATSAVTPEWVELRVLPSGLQSISEEIAKLAQNSQDIKIIRTITEKKTDESGLSGSDIDIYSLEQITPKMVFNKRLEQEKSLDKSDRDKLLKAFAKVEQSVEITNED